MLIFKKIMNENDFSNSLSRKQFVDFLHNHLDEFGDSKDSIDKSIDYAFTKSNGTGGFLLAAYHKNQLVGELVMNKTGMSEYIPEYILVYVAVDGTYRGKGFGKQIVEKALELADGDVKLHVEYNNPAKRLYERIGFTSKYAEMRYHNN